MLIHPSQNSGELFGPIHSRHKGGAKECFVVH